MKTFRPQRLTSSATALTTVIGTTTSVTTVAVTSTLPTRTTSARTSSTMPRSGTSISVGTLSRVTFCHDFASFPLARCTTYALDESWLSHLFHPLTVE